MATSIREIRRLAASGALLGGLGKPPSLYSASTASSSSPSPDNRSSGGAHSSLSLLPSLFPNSSSSMMQEKDEAGGEDEEDNESMQARRVNLNLSPYRDLAPKKEKFRKTTGPVLLALNNKQATPDDPTYFYWLYGYLEYRMQEPEEFVLKKAMRQIDRLVEKLQKLDAKGSLLFDIIATRKHISSFLPHKLGRSIYKYVEDHYSNFITTSFVGLTDNTARRVARDVFCKNKELSRQKYGFDIVDNVHMFVIYPPVGSKNRDGFNAAAFGGNKSRSQSLSPSSATRHHR